MEQLLIGAILVLIILVIDTRQKLAALRQDIFQLQKKRTQPGKVEPVPEPEVAFDPVTRRAARSMAKSAPPPPTAEPVRTPVEPQPEPEPDSIDNEPKPSPKPSAAKRFEDLIGGKLPIWIGGIALVFAGFFLVRFSIEAGLFGPTARCFTAALFGIILITLSEFGNRIPRFGQVFIDDARIGHSIAGAGIAILYATLYMASELYGLMDLAAALVGVIAVTILAFILSQRHGPPTAIMGLLGGFAAPYVAGLGAESVAPLLIYLGVFTAGLFGLAIHRGWAWLALLATGGSVLWTTALLFFENIGDTSFIGAFVVLLAIGGALTLSRTGASFGIPKAAIQAIPLVLGLVQLIIMAPLISFSLMSWILFGILSVFAIAMAWRDEDMTPAVAGALGLSLALVATAFIEGGADKIELISASALAALFGLAGHGFALREKSGWMWALIGLIAPTGILLIAAVWGALAWTDNMWGTVCLITAVTTAIMAWRLRNNETGLASPLASGLTASLLAIAIWLWTPAYLAAVVAVGVALALAFWARSVGRRSIVMETLLAVIISGLIMLVSASGLVEALFTSLVGERDLYTHLPAIADMAVELLVPALAIVFLTYFFRETLGRKTSRFVGVIGMTGTGAFLYLLMKQPLAIGPIEDFVRYGFLERAFFTQLLALSGWLLLRRDWEDKLAGALMSLGLALASLAIFRFLYFDIFLLSPTAVKQSLGPAPIANLGTIHYASAAIWLWFYAKIEWKSDKLPGLPRLLNIASLLAAMAAIMITVRQAVHGTDIATPPFTSTETYLYSAGLLALAIAWLARGIQTTNALLRIAGLLLMTLVTVKVFAFDAQQLEGVLRILSFLGLGIALMGIGWIYGKVMRSEEAGAKAG